MIYLFWYLAIGVVVFLVMTISHRLSTKHESSFVREILDNIQSKNKTWRESLLDEFVLPLLAGIAILTAWPVVIYFMAQGIRSSRKRKAEVEAQKFSVAMDNLVRQMTVEEIEQHEHVTDPMGAVPDLPFGYLNAAWSQFKSNLLPHDSIWSFSTQWTASWGSRQIREGYVIVRADNIGPHFLTSLRWLKDEVKSGSEAPILDIPTFLKKKR